MELAGRGAIITGANRGLGRALAEAYVRAGASVLLVARDEDLLQQVEAELQPQATLPAQKVGICRADVSLQADCAAVLRRAREVLPRVTVLINNAAVLGPIGLIEQVDWGAWVETIRINLLGPVLLCREVIPLMRARGYGKIINLSGGGATAPFPRVTAYAASKAALVRLTETFAEELRDSGVDVNAIAPGAMNTRLLDEMLAAGPSKIGSDYFEKALRQREEGGASPEWAAALAVFLGSAASDGISGRLLSAVWDDWPSIRGRWPRLAKTDVYTLRRIVPEDRGVA